MGHIIKGHVNNGAIVDEEIEPASVDVEEIEANLFAFKLLLGKPHIEYDTQGYFTVEQLAAYAQKIAAIDNVNPGIVVLNYTSYKTNQTAIKKDQQIIWETATKALKIISGDVDAPIQINSYAQQHLDNDRLDTDSQDYLQLVLRD